MQAFKQLHLSFVIALSSFSTFMCQPRSLASSRRQLSVRSSHQRLPLCLLGGHHPLKARIASVAQRTSDEEYDGCGKSTGLLETDDRSDFSHKIYRNIDRRSAVFHSSKTKWFSPKTSYSLSPRSSKHTVSSKSHNKSSHHSLKKKPHRYQQKFAFGRKAGSTVNKSETTVNDNGNAEGDHAPTTSSSAGVVDNPANTVNNSASAVNYPGSEVNHLGSALQDPYTDGVNGDYQGKATFFYQGGNPGACGKVHDDSEFVVAIQSHMYDGGKFCGKTVVVTRKSTGRSIKCVAADECPGCPTHQSLDLSVGAFNALGNPDEGIFDIEWSVID